MYGQNKMNLLFLTMIAIDNLEEKGIYHDLIRKFRDEGHKVVVISPYERGKIGINTIKKTQNEIILRVKTLRIQKSNLIEKGIGTLLINRQFMFAFNKYLRNIKFDLILYSTPPITFAGVVKNIKRKSNSKTYLLLKDIFPQNAVDIGLIKENSLLHKYFLYKEKSLYELSDHIGCMSPANKNYMMQKYPNLCNKLEVNPNSIDVKTRNIVYEEFIQTRKELDIPLNKTIFIYGGNLGKPQGIEFLEEVLHSNKFNQDSYFIIIGDGTEYLKLNRFINRNKFDNVIIKNWMRKEEYEKYLLASDVGLIFLNRNFSIPNFPSRLLSYLEMKKPVLCATDTHTDIGKIAKKNKFGFWCENGDVNKFNDYISFFCENKDLREIMGINGNKYLLDNFTISKSYDIILNHFK